MDAVTLLIAGVNILVSVLILVFVPGFVILLVFFPRFAGMGLTRRLVYSVILSTGSVIVFVLSMDIVRGAYPTSGTVSLGLGVFSVLLIVVWLGELWYLRASAPSGQHRKFLVRISGLRKHISRIVNSRWDRFAGTSMTRVVWHENVPSGKNQIDHTYLIDVGAVIDIQQVDEKKWKFSDGGLLRPPFPKTRNFELFIREVREEGSSMTDDLQIYPVRVIRKSGILFLGHTISRGALAIAERLYSKTDTAEIQWIYTHDFHLFAILYSQDTPGQMVNRVLVKLDEITTSIRDGSRVSSHVEDTQKLRDEFETVLERPHRMPTITEVPIPYPGSSFFSRPIETDRKTLQASIVRDLKILQVTPNTFHRSDNMIRTIRIPDKTDLDMVSRCIREIQDDDWLYT